MKFEISHSFWWTVLVGQCPKSTRPDLDAQLDWLSVIHDANWKRSNQKVIQKYDTDISHFWIEFQSGKECQRRKAGQNLNYTNNSDIKVASVAPNRKNGFWSATKVYFGKNGKNWVCLPTKAIAMLRSMLRFGCVQTPLLQKTYASQNCLHRVTWFFSIDQSMKWKMQNTDKSTSENSFRNRLVLSVLYGRTLMSSSSIRQVLNYRSL